MKKLALVFLFSIILAPVISLAQYEADFFGLDTLGDSRKMVLPLIYFPENSAEISDRAKEDISYIAFMLHQHPEATLRIRTQALYKRFDRKPRRLNKRRMKRIRRLLKKDFQISRRRLVTIHHQPWQYRSANDPRPSKLVQRRVVCDIIWD